MKMTVSEKIARVFEIAGYVWLLPSIISLIYPIIFLIGSFVAASPGGVLLSAIPLFAFGTGIFLLINYFKHSRGLLDEDKILPLWVGTLAFNLIFLLPSVYGFYSTFGVWRGDGEGQTTGFLIWIWQVLFWASSQSIREGQVVILLIWVLLTFWSATAVLLSLAAIAGELKSESEIPVMSGDFPVE